MLSHFDGEEEEEEAEDGGGKSRRGKTAGYVPDLWAELPRRSIIIRNSFDWLHLSKCQEILVSTVEN